MAHHTGKRTSDEWERLSIQKATNGRVQSGKLGWQLHVWGKKERRATDAMIFDRELAFIKLSSILNVKTKKLFSLELELWIVELERGLLVGRGRLDRGVYLCLHRSGSAWPKQKVRF